MLLRTTGKDKQGTQSKEEKVLRSRSKWCTTVCRRRKCKNGRTPWSSNQCRWRFDLLTPPPRPPPPPVGPLLRFFCHDGISGGGGACSLARPPRSGTNPIICFCKSLFVFSRTDAELVFSKCRRSSLAASNSIKSTDLPPCFSASNCLRFSEYRHPNLSSLVLAASDHWNDCTVTSRRVISISRRKLYSVSNSRCNFSNLFHCSNDNCLLGANNGFPNDFCLATSLNRLNNFSKNAFGVIFCGGLPRFKLCVIDLSATAAGLSSCRKKNKTLISALYARE